MTAGQEYSSSVTSQAVADERRRLEASLCQATTVEVNRPVEINGHTHMATLQHKCILDKGHKAEYCRCRCDHGWRKIG